MSTVDLMKGIGRRIWSCALHGRRINSVSVLAECLFWRLHLVADDYGNFRASPKWVKDNAMPGRQFTPARIQVLLDELSQSSLGESPALVTFYKVRDEVFGNITGFEDFQPPGRNGKRVRKFPIQDASGCVQVQAGASRCESQIHVAPSSSSRQAGSSSSNRSMAGAESSSNGGCLPAPPRASGPVGPGELPPDADLRAVLEACGIDEPLRTFVVESGKVTAPEVRSSWDQAVSGSSRKLRPVRDIGAALAATLQRRCGIQQKPKAHVGTTLGELNRMVLNKRAERMQPHP